MPINKRKFQVSNDKKVLHKVRKHWAVISLAMLAAIGTGTVSTTANADTKVSGNQTNDGHDNQNRVNVKTAQPKATLVKNNVRANAETESNDTKVDNRKLMQQADVLHNRIMANMLTRHHNEPNVNANVHIPKQSTSQSVNKPIQMKNRAIRLGGIHEELSQSPSGPQTKASDGHWIYHSDGNNNITYLSDGEVDDWKTDRQLGQPSGLDGLHFRYSASNKALEFDGGTAQTNLTDFMSDGATDGLTDYIRSTVFFSDTSVKFTNVNMTNVSNMSKMFYKKNITSLALSDSFNTKNVTNMSQMFRSDADLQTLVLPDNFNTSKVNDMYYMFTNDTGLTSLTLSNNFDTDNVNDMTSVLSDESALNTLIIKSPNTKFNSDALVDNWSNPNESNPAYTPAYTDKYGTDCTWYGYNPSTNTYSPVNLMDGESHVGTWKSSEPAKSTVKVNYMYNGVSEGSDSDSGYGNVSITVGGNTHPKLKNGYHLAISNSQTFTSGTNKVNVLPNTVTVNYKDGATSEGSHQFSDSTAQAGSTQMTVTSSDIKNNVPNGYALTSTPTNTTVSYGGSKDVSVKLNQATDTIDYQYNGHTITSDNQIAGTPNGKLVINSSYEPKIPANYHLRDNSDNFTYDGKTHNVAVLPNQVSDTINYQYNNRTVAHHKFKGNDVNARGAKDTSFDVDSSNEPDIPSGYQLVNTDNKFSYDGDSHNVAIKPIQDTDTINYQYKGNTIASYQPVGNDTSDITINSSNHPNMPDHYNLVNAANQFKYDGKSHPVAITPEQKTDTIDYQLDGTTKASDTFTGNDYQAQDASDTTFTIDSSNDPKLPSGYHLVKSSNTFNYDGGTHDVAIAPSTANTSVKYVNQVTGSDAGSYSDKIDDGTDLTISATAPQSLDTSKYHLASSQAPSFRSGTTNNTVDVLPNTATVKYMSGSTQEGSDQTVRPSSAPKAGDTSFTIDSNNLPKVPANYRVASSNPITLSYGKTNTVSVAPDQVTLTFIFYNARDGRNVKVGSDAPMTQNAGTQINTGSLSLPKGYHLADDVSPTITFNKTGYQKISVVANDNNPINQPNDADDIPVEGNLVYFTGNIILKFPDNANTESIKIPYSIKTTVDSKISNILKSGTPSVVIPSNYVGKVIQQFNTANFTYNGQTSSSEYDGVYVKPVYGTNGQPNVTNNGNNKYTYQNPDITFNFNANSMNEDIYYKYGDDDENDDDTPEVMSGANDTTGDVTSAVASSTGASGDLKPGWQLASANNDFTYGNGGNDSTGRYSDNYDVSVTPQSASTVVQYKVSDAKATNNGSTLASYSASGNEYQATDAGNNDLTISQSSGVDNIPKGYSIISGQHTTFPYNNGQNNTVKIIGNMHNNGGKDLTPSTTKPTTPSDQSDVVTVNENEYNGSVKVGTITQYVAESGRTGESFTVNPDDFMPNDYQTDSADRPQTGTFAANGISGIPNNTVNFKYDAEQGSDINVTYINQNDATVGNGSISGNYGTTGNVQTTVSGKMPGGYDYENATENNEPVTTYQITKSPQNIIVHVSGKQVKGIVPLRLIYKESNGTVDSDVSNDYMPFTSRVGDTVAVNPINYERINYDDENQVQTFPMDWNSVKNDLNNYKTPIVTFNYVGPTGNVDVTYVDVSAGAQPDPSESDKMVTYQGHQDPVVGTQNLSNMGVVGSTVYLAAKGANVSGAKDVLAVPNGFHLVNNSNPIKVLLSNSPQTIRINLMSAVPEEPAIAGNVTVNYVHDGHVVDTQTLDQNNAGNAYKWFVGNQVPLGPTNSNDHRDDLLQVPNHYQLASDDHVAKLTDDNQTLDVEVNPLPAKPTVAGMVYITYKSNGQPVGTQILTHNNAGNYQWNVGSVIPLGLTNSNDHRDDVLDVPNGYQLASDDNAVTLTKDTKMLTINVNSTAQPAPAPQPTTPAPSTPAPVSTPAPQPQPQPQLTQPRIRKMTPPTHFRWFYVIKPCLAHYHLKSVGQVKDYVKVLKPGHDITAHIMKIVQVRGRKGKSHYRYEIRMKHGKHYRYYYVTGDRRFTRNAYIQPHELHHIHGLFHHYFNAKVLQDAWVHTKKHYSVKNRVKILKRGKIVHIKRVVNIGRRGDYQTRFQLTNGKYVTANKNWIKLVK